MELNRDIKSLLILNSILLVFPMLTGLISLAWGTSVMYGSLIGIGASLAIIGLNALLSQKFGKWLSWGTFIIKVGIYALVTITPLLTINKSVYDSGINMTLYPINIWMIIATVAFIPISTMLLYQPFNNKIYEKIINKK